MEEFEFSWQFGIWINVAAVATGVAFMPCRPSRVIGVATAVALTMMTVLLAVSEVVNWIVLQ